jgi:hypothetical protein
VTDKFVSMTELHSRKLLKACGVLAVLFASVAGQTAQTPEAAKRPRCPNAWKVTPANPKLAEKTDAWTSETENEDGILAITYCWVFQPGLTSIKRLAPVKLTQLPEGLDDYERHAKAIGEKVRMNELPPGFSVYKGQAFEIKTAMVQSEASVTVRLPSVKSEAEFGKLFLLYLDEDSMVPGALQWETYPEYLGQQRSDFKTRTITAGFDYFTIFHHSTGAGRLVVASFNQEEYDKSSIDLYFTSIVGPPYVKPGEIFSYSISIKNLGGTGLAADDVVVNSSINNGRFVSATSSQGRCRKSVNSDPDIICELGRVTGRQRRRLRESEITEVWPLNVFALVGAQATFTKIQLQPAQSFTLKLTDLGIPDDAKILDINYTSQGGSLIALESQTNNPHRFIHNIRHEIVLHPVPFRYGEPEVETPVGVFITWVPHTANDEPWENLINACRAYYSHQFTSAIIPANVAVEARLSRLLTSFLEGFAAKERVGRFLDDAATYSYQLNVLLPVFAELRNAPQLPDHIRGHLNSLRSYRNEIAHDGALTKPPTKEDVANCLCAALFAFHYLNLIEGILLGHQKPLPMNSTKLL